MSKLRVLTVAGSLLALLVPAVGSAAPDPAAACNRPSSRLLSGWSSPYIGHTGSQDGMGGSADNPDRSSDMQVEKAMGLRWTLIPVFWSKFEPDGPVRPSFSGEEQGPWEELDATIAKARKLRLNVLLQAPVMGGNAGAPPGWAGSRKTGTSAPANMQAAVDFAGKLVDRYKPCGALAQHLKWKDGYGVRAWELDNEPDSYQTNWGDVADDYAEFVTKVSARLKRSDRHAVVVGAATSSGAACPGRFVDDILDSRVQAASDTYLKNKKAYAAGPAFDVVSFHMYELLQKIPFGCGADAVEEEYRDIRARFDSYRNQKGFAYPRKSEYWHTEGGYDFALFDPGAGYKANWTLQYFARGFSAGVSKLVIQDAHHDPLQQQAVRTMMSVLPDPHGLKDVTRTVGVDPAVASVYVLTRSDGRRVYLAFAGNTGAGATVSLPVRGRTASLVSRAGARSSKATSGGKVTVSLPGGAPFSEPLFVVES